MGFFEVHVYPISMLSAPNGVTHRSTHLQTRVYRFRLESFTSRSSRPVSDKGGCMVATKVAIIREIGNDTSSGLRTRVVTRDLAVWLGRCGER